MLLIYYTLKSQNLSIKEERANTEYERELDLLIRLSSNIREDFDKIQLFAGDGKKYFGLDSIGTFKDHMDFHKTINGYYPSSVRLFYKSCQNIEQRLENVLKRNFESNLNFKDKELIFDEFQFHIEALKSLRISTRNVTPLINWDETNNAFIRSDIELYNLPIVIFTLEKYNPKNE